jgi:hypothetical protein
MYISKKMAGTLTNSQSIQTLENISTALLDNGTPQLRQGAEISQTWPQRGSFHEHTELADHEKVSGALSSAYSHPSFV